LKELNRAFLVPEVSSLKIEIEKYHKVLQWINDWLISTESVLSCYIFRRGRKSSKTATTRSSISSLGVLAGMSIWKLSDKGIVKINGKSLPGGTSPNIQENISELVGKVDSLIA